MTARAHAGLERNVRLYPWYVVTADAYFWLPVFFLYFREHLDLAAVLKLEAIYYACVVVLEIPSGYFSDRVGRRPTLLVSSVALATSYLLFTLGDGFTLFAAAQAALAAGIAFRSGTDVAFHYDSLEALGRAESFGPREARVERAGFLAGAVAAVAGGAIAVLGLRWAYVLSLVAALAGLLIVSRFTEPPAHPDGGAERPVRQVLRCLGLLRAGPLRWLFAFSVLMTVLNHIPYEFYQPLLEKLRGDAGLPEVTTPLSLGIVAALTMLVAARVAAQSIRLRDRMGTAAVLLASTALQGVIILGMGLVLHPVVLVLVLLRSVPRGLMAAPLKAAIAPRVAQARRATFLSIQSLAGRAAFSSVLFGLSFLAAPGGAGDWPDVRRMLLVSAAIAAAGLLALGLTARTLRDASGDTMGAP